MRILVKSEKMPSKEVLLEQFASSLHASDIASAINILYGTLSMIAGCVGFSLVRFDFFEMRVIMAKTYDVWTFEFSKYK